MRVEREELRERCASRIAPLRGSVIMKTYPHTTPYTSGSYKDLIVWHKGIQLCNIIYTITKKLPEDERYGLMSQMRRSAVSIPSNIAEGHGRGMRKEFKHFLRIAYGSAAELETQLTIVSRLSLISEEELRPPFSLLDETMRMLNALIRS